MSKKVYVGNIPYQTTDEDLKQLFGQYGTVITVAIIKDRDTGRSKGFAFVEMEDTAEAIKNLDGKDFNGRAIKVNEALERHQKANNQKSNRW